MPMPAEIIEAQTQDLYCRNVWTMVGTDPMWLLNEHALPCKILMVDGNTQNILPQKFRAAVLHYAHNLNLAGHRRV